jgi:hypothetical protein
VNFKILVGFSEGSKLRFLPISSSRSSLFESIVFTSKEGEEKTKECRRTESLFCCLALGIFFCFFCSCASAAKVPQRLLLLIVGRELAFLAVQRRKEKKDKEGWTVSPLFPPSASSFRVPPLFFFFIHSITQIRFSSPFFFSLLFSPC